MITVLAMPCFNEADGIEEFLNDLLRELDNKVDYFVVLNDSSSDTTLDVLRHYSERVPKLRYLSNSQNLGHGPSFVNAIKYALSLDPTIIITVDGDGQFEAREISEALQDFMGKDFDILEGVRINRTDPIFRKVVTYVLRLLVWVRARNRPLDSNTPFRIYRVGALKSLIEQIPDGSLIPNLRISILTRKNKFRYIEKRVQSLSRRGVSSSGSTWKARWAWIPSKRFIHFCRTALIELWKFPV